ncbi:hypothetical protein DDD_2548 [Nonlabens dokdonensis DSW-6]|uniref:Uncharacterized protein n=1 Tax=Nonlabens dokdonensis (strain DSM 17205 / KCTC 12402 / DSW-6) TaxID=592029 RepID=L7W7K6_NONDD|nr:hypothetical protein DDD_2548 [Nonlabens dokdonensis DSW-6]
MVLVPLSRKRDYNKFYLLNSLKEVISKSEITSFIYPQDKKEFRNSCVIIKSSCLSNELIVDFFYCQRSTI